MKENKKIGVALSGGGYRATIYHLGTLKKLNDLNLLDKVDIISTNSGGSITGAVYGLYGNDFKNFERIIRKGVKSSIIKGVLTSTIFLRFLLFSIATLFAVFYFIFSSYAWIGLLIFIVYIFLFLIFQFNILPLSVINEEMYNKYFFKGKCLSDFSSDKTIAINTTNAETGKPFTFSKNKMSDSSYTYPKDKGSPIIFKHNKFPIARAVAASTSVPFVFTPIRINKKYFNNPNDYKRASPKLIDGGIYDNQGVHKLVWSNSSYRCDIILVSDAGNIIPFKNTYRNVISLLIRTSDIFMDRIKNFQMIQLIYNKDNKNEVAYQSLGFDIENSISHFVENIQKGYISDDVIHLHNIQKSDIKNEKWKEIIEYLGEKIDYKKIVKNANTKEQLKLARSVGTNLTSLSDAKINALVNHAYVITEIQLQLYCPTLFK